MDLFSDRTKKKAAQFALPSSLFDPDGRELLIFRAFWGARARARRAAAFEMDILRYRQRAGSIMGSFAKSSRWCQSYLEVCRRLSALAKTLPAGEAKAALRKRVGQIALSVVKNIPAYHLPETVASEAMAFAREHRGELSGYALESGDAPVAAQGLLLRLSPKAFMKLYTRV